MAIYLDFEKPLQELDKQIKKIMENCIPELKVPSKVDISIGKNWGQTDEIT